MFKRQINRILYIFNQNIDSLKVVMSFKGAALDVLEAFGWFVVTERYFTVCALVFPHFYLFGAFVGVFFLNCLYSCCVQQRILFPH